MPKKINPEVEAFAKIKVVGIGGSGKNAINHMINSKVKGVEFIVVNTDAQDLENSQSKKKIHIGKNLTRGLGTGMNPELGKRAAEETKEEVQEALKGADMVFVTGGKGGGTFTGAGPVVARVAKDLGALTIGVATRPFGFEGAQRSRVADEGLRELRQHVDALITIPNDNIFGIIEKETTVRNAFAMADEILRQAVEGISDLITSPGIINVDFADIRAVLGDAGTALMGIGLASGENRASEAAKKAINSPLLDISITGAKGVLFSIAGGEDLAMAEIQDAANVITESVDKDAKIIFGTAYDNGLKKGEIKVTVIASGFDQNQPGASSLFGMGAQKEREEKNSIFNIARNDKESEGAETPAKKDRVDDKKEKEEVPTITRRKVEDADEEDDWSAVPAFLRRKK
jgi:cell division protein FtsZ